MTWVSQSKLLTSTFGISSWKSHQPRCATQRWSVRGARCTNQFLKTTLTNKFECSCGIEWKRANVGCSPWTSSALGDVQLDSPAWWCHLWSLMMSADSSVDVVVWWFKVNPSFFSSSLFSFVLFSYLFPFFPHFLQCMLYFCPSLAESGIAATCPKIVWCQFDVYSILGASSVLADLNSPASMSLASSAMFDVHSLTSMSGIFADINFFSRSHCWCQLTGFNICSASVPYAMLSTPWGSYNYMCP